MQWDLKDMKILISQNALWSEEVESFPNGILGTSSEGVDFYWVNKDHIF